MKELDSRLISAVPGRTRMRVTFRHRNLWLMRLLGSPPYIDLESVYQRDGDVWLLVADNNRATEVHKSLFRTLTEIEARLIGAEYAGAK
jgi:hypothetical protein